MKIAFLHPDLGIGGAERLVVDAAIALVQNNHNVDVYTSHYNVSFNYLLTRRAASNAVARFMY